MNNFWHSVFARFKPRLSLVDLQRTTEDTFDLCLRSRDTQNHDMFQALMDAEPLIDHSARWRDDFQPILEQIASRPSRKSQAAECRKTLLERIENRSLLWALICIYDGEIREALIEAIFPDVAIQSSEINSVQLLTKQYLYYLLDCVALTLVYTQQFNSTVRVDAFDTSYDAMCKMGAEIMTKKVLASGMAGMATPTVFSSDQAYLHEIVEPLEKPLEEIKRRFKGNLSLLSPEKPDNSHFLSFLNTYSKQLEVFKQVSSSLG